MTTATTLLALRRCVRACVAMIVGVSLLAGSALAEGIGIYQATLAETDAKTPEISTEQMRHVMAQGSAIIVDTRTPLEFAAGHIPRARNLDAPLSAHVAAIERLVGGDKSKPLVLYCNGPFCQASRRLSEQLVPAGFTNVRRYQLGIPI